MAFKIGKNFKQKTNTDDALQEINDIITEQLFDTYYKQCIINTNNPNVSDNLFNPDHIAQINYNGIVSELPDINESEIGQLVLKQYNDNYIPYIFDGKSWVELDTNTYNVRIDSANHYTDIYGNNYWRIYDDNCIKCDVKIKDKALYDNIYGDCI